MSDMQSQTIGALAEALAKAQGSMESPAKTKRAKIESQKGSYSYTYADLSDIVDAIRKPLSENGLSVAQVISYDGQALVLTTQLQHASGEWLRSTYPLPLHQRPQDQGSAITYARRYALCALLGIAAEDDDDGQAAQQAKPPATKAPAAKPPNNPPATLPLTEDDQQKLANWEASLETKHSPEDIARARKNASVLQSAALKAAVMDAIERHAKRSAA